MDTTQLKTGIASVIKNILYVSCIGVFAFMTPSCSKSSDKSHLSIQMTDAPANYDAVMIDIQSVEVTGNGGATVMLNTSAGVYNLLNFSNGLDTLIASGDLDAGTVSQIRLILGPNNAVIIDGVSYPLDTPSAQQSGLKLQVHKTFEPGVSYSMLLDFDANQSIVAKGNGGYSLKPVIRTTEVALTGSIKGSITPVGTIATVTATAGGISYSSVTNVYGQFLISGLPAGTYSITVTPDLPLLPVTVISKVVVIGSSTNLGIIVL